MESCLPEIYRIHVHVVILDRQYVKVNFGSKLHTYCIGAQGRSNTSFDNKGVLRQKSVEVLYIKIASFFKGNVLNHKEKLKENKESSFYYHIVQTIMSSA